MTPAGQRKKIAITIGDPAGIGPEVTLKALLSEEVKHICRPLIIGDRAVIEEAAEALDIPIETAALDIVDMKEITGRGFEKGHPSSRCGSASVRYIRKAVELAKAGVVDAIVTAPITKESLKLAGFPWPGHTEMLAEFTASRDVAMMLCGGPLRVILATIHTALRDVPRLITRERVLRTIYRAQEATAMLGIEKPRIAVAGLNPHAGESGLFGDEEHTAIGPAVEEALARGIDVSGPFPADTLFHRAYKGEYDIVVCMYHDQGLVPLKMIAIDRGVNVTVGLPIIRTSPDHGTAHDIAWKGTANPSSMIEAIRTATVLRRVRAL
jgi:4-hydroxythreonine-4-phosphate dehydrogenase